MQIGIATQDARNAGLLVREFARLFGGEHVSLNGDGKVEVDIDNRSIREALDAAQRWLEETQTGCVQVSVHGQTYMLERPAGELQAPRQPGPPTARNLSDDWLREAGMNRSSNGARFIRTVNNSIYDALFKFVSEDGEFWCECDDAHCEERITLTLREYAALRERADEPLLSRNHAPVSLPQ